MRYTNQALRKEIRDLNFQKSEFWNQRNELEQIFVQCVEAVKIDI